MLLLKEKLSNLTHFFMPPLCFSCLEANVVSDGLCANCFQKLNFIEKPYCKTCCLPFDLTLDDNLICGSCLDHPPAYDEARSAIVYEDVGRKLVLNFKNRNRTEMRKIFKSWLLKIGAPYVDDADMIIPVPLHWTKLIKRTYNQAGILAQTLSKETHVPYKPFLLRCIKKGVSQKTLSKEKRLKNLSKTFHVPLKQKHYLKGKKVLLIDDIMTTGATAHYAARALKRAGASHVYVLCLARVTLQR